MANEVFFWAKRAARTASAAMALAASRDNKNPARSWALVTAGVRRKTASVMNVATRGMAQASHGSEGSHSQPLGRPRIHLVVPTAALPSLCKGIPIFELLRNALADRAAG